MKKFKLQKLLDIRVQDEEESKVVYVQAQNKKKKVEEQLDMLQENYEKHSNIKDVSDVVTQKITINYLSSLTQTIKSTEEQLEKEEKNVNSAKNDLIEKQIKRKSLETLKKNTLEKIKKEEQRVEQITNDEFALYSYLRNRVSLS